jgi:RNA polymerase sigma-70 factor (ECF subfamily)
MADKQDDKPLVADLKAGGNRRKEAVKGLYGELSGPMLAFFRRKGLDNKAAEDLLHETFVNLLRGIDGYRCESPLRAWVWAIARNEMRMYWRAAERREDPEEPETLAMLRVGSDDGPRDTAELIDCVRAALSQFEHQFRDQAQALRLIVQYEWGIAEVAEHLGRTIGATREYLSQARKRLAPFIEHCRGLLEGETP